MKFLSFLPLALLSIAAPGRSAADEPRPKVATLRVPGGGIQPQVALGRDGVVHPHLHLIYYRGDPRSGDIFYVHSKDDGATFSTPLRVNRQEGSAVAAGNIRGAQLALGKDDRVHVAWNGSQRARPRGPPNPELPDDSPYKHSAPLLYTRLRDDRSGFEAEHNLMTSTYALDGGGSVAADQKGNVYVTWHAPRVGGPKGEAGRAVWIARSTDDGRTFSPETKANSEPTGACGCCGLRSFVDRRGVLYTLYRTATSVLKRDMYLLVSEDRARRSRGARIHPWNVPKCVMSLSSFFETPAGAILAAWETEEQVYYARVDRTSPAISKPIAAPGPGKVRKFPVVAANDSGEVILAWTEGMRWGKGGTVRWQVFDRDGKPIPGAEGRAAGVPPWSLVAVFPRRDGGFTVVY